MTDFDWRVATTLLSSTISTLAPSCASLHGALRNQEGVGTHAGFDARAHELSGQQSPFRIGKLGAHRRRAGRLVDRQVEEVEMPDLSV